LSLPDAPVAAPSVEPALEAPVIDVADGFEEEDLKSAVPQPLSTAHDSSAILSEPEAFTSVPFRFVIYREQPSTTTGLLHDLAHQ
jgi:hypothetical protein